MEALYLKITGSLKGLTLLFGEIFCVEILAHPSSFETFIIRGQLELCRESINSTFCLVWTVCELQMIIWNKNRALGVLEQSWNRKTFPWDRWLAPSDRSNNQWENAVIDVLMVCPDTHGDMKIDENEFLAMVSETKMQKRLSDPRLWSQYDHSSYWNTQWDDSLTIAARSKFTTRQHWKRMKRKKKRLFGAVTRAPPATLCQLLLGVIIDFVEKLGQEQWRRLLFYYRN